MNQRVTMVCLAFMLLLLACSTSHGQDDVDLRTQTIVGCSRGYADPVPYFAQVETDGDCIVLVVDRGEDVSASAEGVSFVHTGAPPLSLSDVRWFDGTCHEWVIAMQATDGLAGAQPAPAVGSLTQREGSGDYVLNGDVDVSTPVSTKSIHFVDTRLVVVAGQCRRTM